MRRAMLTAAVVVAAVGGYLLLSLLLERGATPAAGDESTALRSAPVSPPAGTEAGRAVTLQVPQPLSDELLTLEIPAGGASAKPPPAPVQVLDPRSDAPLVFMPAADATDIESLVAELTRVQVLDPESSPLLTLQVGGDGAADLPTSDEAGTVRVVDPVSGTASSLRTQPSDPALDRFRGAGSFAEPPLSPQVVIHGGPGASPPTPPQRPGTIAVPHPLGDDLLLFELPAEPPESR